jgi:hypothetical protein
MTLSLHSLFDLCLLGSLLQVIKFELITKTKLELSADFILVLMGHGLDMISKFDATLISKLLYNIQTPYDNTPFVLGISSRPV